MKSPGTIDLQQSALVPITGSAVQNFSSSALMYKTGPLYISCRGIHEGLKENIDCFSSHYFNSYRLGRFLNTSN